MNSPAFVPWRIDALHAEDLPGSACVHRLAFPNSAIAQLGLATAERYHGALLARNDVVAFGAFERSRVIGFCFAGTAASPEGEFLRHHFGFIAGQLFRRPLLLTRPFIRDRIRTGLQLLGRRNLTSASPETPESMGALLVLYLAVAPSHQRRGVARTLLERVESHARRARFSCLELSVYPDNRRAIEFYEHAGWRRTPGEGAWQGFMGKALPANEA